jgi:hypothetical protein
VETRSRTVETQILCPHCGGKLHVRQIGFIPAEAQDVVTWSDQGRFCPRGCQYTADEVTS